MGSGLGPRIPVNNLEFAYDPRNATASVYKSILGDITGTVTGASLSGLGFNFGLLLSGATDVINFSTSARLNLSSALTVMGWIYPVSFGGASAGRIFDKFKTTIPQSGYALWIDNSSGTNSISYGTGLSITTSVCRLNNQVTLNTWQHFAAVHSGSTVTFYKNGASIGSSGSMTLPTNSSAISACVGNNSSATNNFDGTLGTVRVYSTALTAKDISQIYFAQKSRYGL